MKSKNIDIFNNAFFNSFYTKCKYQPPAIVRIRVSEKIDDIIDLNLVEHVWKKIEESYGR